MKRWPIILAAIAAIVFVATACAPPPPVQPRAAWYDWATDTITYNTAWMELTRTWYGQDGVDWTVAHEEGHRTTNYRLRDGVDIAALMPGPTVPVRLEQAAQCLAEASLGHEPPWQWGPDQVADGYWDCPADYVALVGAA